MREKGSADPLVSLVGWAENSLSRRIVSGYHLRGGCRAYLGSLGYSERISGLSAS